MVNLILGCSYVNSRVTVFAGACSHPCWMSVVPSYRRDRKTAPGLIG